MQLLYPWGGAWFVDPVRVEATVLTIQIFRVPYLQPKDGDLVLLVGSFAAGHVPAEAEPRDGDQKYPAPGQDSCRLRDPALGAFGPGHQACHLLLAAHEVSGVLGSIT